MLFAVVALGMAQPPSAATKSAIYLSAREAAQALRPSPDAPAELKTLTDAAFAAAWPKWAASCDAEIRARLERGQEDSLANLLMFGTSYTRQPRITPEFMAELDDPNSPGLRRLIEITEARVRDLMAALARPSSERMREMRALVDKLGYSPVTASGREQLRKYLMADLLRVRNELAAYAEQSRTAREAPDADQGFLARSSLFQNRGIALDTSLLPNFAIEQALKQLAQRGDLRPGSIRQVAIIGPGLDFVDKDEGYDFYPAQTVQPFALIDSLQRLGLAARDLRVTTFDISARVNQHIVRAQAQARQGRAYTVQLPRDPARNWRPEAVAYWQHFGETIGSAARPLPVPPALGRVEIRAVRIRPQVVARVTPVDLNVVASYLDLPAARQFDLIIATNVFVYYSKFEQNLALMNLAHLLRPSGFLLSNDFLPDLPASGIRRLGDTAVPYSSKPGDGDRVVWYRRQESRVGSQ